jgi:hypothetical protein
MAIVPFVARQAVLAPFIVVNWTLFIATGFLLRSRAKVAELTWQQSRNWDRLFLAALVAFTLAGWSALSSGNPMF